MVKLCFAQYFDVVFAQYFEMFLGLASVGSGATGC